MWINTSIFILKKIVDSRFMKPSDEHVISSYWGIKEYNIYLFQKLNSFLIGKVTVFTKLYSCFWFIYKNCREFLLSTYYWFFNMVELWHGSYKTRLKMNSVPDCEREAPTKQLWGIYKTLAIYLQFTKKMSKGNVKSSLILLTIIGCPDRLTMRFTVKPCILLKNLIHWIFSNFYFSISNF